MAIDLGTTREGGDPSALYDTLFITAAALRAHPEEPELIRLAAWLGGMLTDWEGILSASWSLKKRALESAAHLRVADALLDHALAAFAGAVLDEVHGDTSHQLYRRFFPEPHQDVIDLGLDAEIPVAAHIVVALDQDKTLAAPLRDQRGAVAAAVALGNRAMAARADALADLGRHQARTEAWAESAGSMHRSVARTLHHIAETRKLSSRWVRSFV